MADIAKPTRTSFEVAAEVANLLKTLSRAQRKEVLQLVASRDDLRVVSMDRPIGRVGIPGAASDRKSPPRRKKSNKTSPKVGQAGAIAPVQSPVRAAVANPAPLHKDEIIIRAQRERDTIVSELKTLSKSSDSDPAAITNLISEKEDREALIRARRKELRLLDPGAK